MRRARSKLAGRPCGWAEGLLLETATDPAAAAVERGIPGYTEGPRLLISGLKLFSFRADGEDHEVRDALDRLRPFMAAADLAQPTTTFLGSSPAGPSEVPAYDLPASRRGLAIVYDVRVTDLVTSGLIEPDVALSIGGFPLQFPAEAHLTAEERVRLPDGREFTDLVAAAAAATGLDIWHVWQSEHSGALPSAREPARRGQLA